MQNTMVLSGLMYPALKFYYKIPFSAQSAHWLFGVDLFILYFSFLLCSCAACPVGLLQCTFILEAEPSSTVPPWAGT
jgi:hypothetical protein